jgi:hypothetical protein
MLKNLQKWTDFFHTVHKKLGNPRSVTKNPDPAKKGPDPAESWSGLAALLEGKL